MEFSVCPNPHHMMLHVFSHVNQGDGDFLQMKCPNRKDRREGVPKVRVCKPQRTEFCFVLFSFRNLQKKNHNKNNKYCS